MSAKFDQKKNLSDKQLRREYKKILGFRPGKIDYYRQALYHKSYAIKKFNSSLKSNERLEFLGDAILDSIVAEHIYFSFPNENEGFLTQLRSKIVNRETLKRISIKLGIANLVVSRIVNDKQKYLYGDAMEAVIGAIYLDKGYKKTKQFVLDVMIKHHINLNELSRTEVDFKSRVIEWGQKNKKEINFTCNQEVAEDTKDPVFVSHILIFDQIAGMGSGSSKKEAEQNAAQQALEYIGD